jgi:hypothetical protein
MTEQRDESNVARVYPRTVEGWCSCSYCTALRAGTLEALPDEPSEWRRRMGSVAR